MTATSLEHIRHLVAFHHWAGGKAFDALAPVTAAQLDRQWGGSFGTGRGLLQHVVGAERLWVNRWNGVSGKIPAYPTSHSGREFGVEWQQVATEQRQFLRAFSESQLQGDLTYVNMKGETKTYPFSHILVHCVNHGTYHRGQITQLLRDLGLAAPTTDYLYFEPDQR